MKIQSGRIYSKNVVLHDFDGVSFVTDDGREMFEVTIGKDQRSIDVRGIEVCKVDGKLYSQTLVIEPHVSNSITIRTKLYK